MFFNHQHEQHFHELEEAFNPNGEKRQKVLNNIFALPSIYSSFKEALTVQSPIEVAIQYLDGNAPVARNLSSGEVHLLKLGVELYNGTESLESGTFKLYEAFNSWDNEYIALFYHILQIVRPVTSNQA